MDTFVLWEQFKCYICSVIDSTNTTWLHESCFVCLFCYSNKVPVGCQDTRNAPILHFPSFYLICIHLNLNLYNVGLKLFPRLSLFMQNRVLCLNIWTFSMLKWVVSCTDDSLNAPFFVNVQLHPRFTLGRINKSMKMCSKWTKGMVQTLVYHGFITIPRGKKS